MADPIQTLLESAKCYTCIGASVEDTLELALLKAIAGGSTPPPVVVTPAVPGNIDISDASTINTVTVTWTNSDVPTTNEIWKSTDGVIFAFKASVAGTVHSYVDPGAIGIGEQWYYKVQACNGPAHCSAFTAVRSAGRQLSNLGAATYNYPTLVIHLEDFDTGGGGVVTSVNWPLCRICDRFILDTEPALLTVSVPSFVSIFGNFEINFCPNVVGALTLDALTTVAGQFQIFDAGFTSLSLGALTSTASHLNAANCTNLLTMSVPVLAGGLGGQLAIFGNPALTTFSAPSLTNINGLGFLQDNPLMTTCTLTSLVSVNGSFQFDNDAALTTLNLPAFVTPSSNWTATNCTALTTLSIPNVIFTDGLIMDFTNCALVAGVSASGTGVNGVLARGIASGVTGFDFELSGGTSAAPSGQGIVDKGVLQGLGNTVNTN